MKLKMILAAAALFVSPTLALAACSGHADQVMTCAEGMQYDTATNTCKVMSS